jgi:hypothetical protein
LPDGIFSNQKSQFGKFFEGLAMEDIGIFYGHLVYLTASRHCCGHLVYFFGILDQEKSGNPGRTAASS